MDLTTDEVRMIEALRAKAAGEARPISTREWEVLEAIRADRVSSAIQLLVRMRDGMGNVLEAESDVHQPVIADTDAILSIKGETRTGASHLTIRRQEHALRLRDHEAAGGVRVEAGAQVPVRNVVQGDPFHILEVDPEFQFVAALEPVQRRVELVPREAQRPRAQG